MGNCAVAYANADCTKVFLIQLDTDGQYPMWQTALDMKICL